MNLFNKYYIDVKSFFKKGVKKVEEPFGVFMVNGRQGSGKSFFCVKWVYQNYTNYKIRTNITSLKIKNRDIEYFTKLDEIYNDTISNCVYIIDELGKRFTKDSKCDSHFYEFLQQCRKNKRIVFLIHQEYLQTPNWMRGPVNEIITTRKIFPFLPIFVTFRGLPYLNENCEWQVEYNSLYVYKRTREVSKLYNTFETVSTL